MDLVYTLDENVIEDKQYEVPLGKSDHATLRFDYKLKGHVNQTSEPVRNYWKADYSKIRKELEAVDWAGELDGLDTQQTWLVIKKCLNEATEKFVPLKTGTKKQKVTG